MHTGRMPKAGRPKSGGGKQRKREKELGGGPEAWCAFQPPTELVSGNLVCHLVWRGQVKINDGGAVISGITELSPFLNRL